jgi:hypothetical protein
VAAAVPIAPAGLEMPRWFDVIERDPFVRTVGIGHCPGLEATRTVAELLLEFAAELPRAA